MYERFSIRSFIHFGWVTVKQNYPFFLGMTIILILIYAILFSLDLRLEDADAGLRLGFWLVNTIVQAWITLGVIRIALAFCDGKKPHITELFAEFHHLAQYIAGMLIVFLITNLYILVVGTMLLFAMGIGLPSLRDLFAQEFDLRGFILKQSLLVQIAGIAAIVVPLLILNLRLQFFAYFIIDQESGPLESIGRSWDATRGFTLRLLLLLVLIVLINIAGFCALAVGLTLTIPLSLLALAAAYRVLAARTIEEDDQ